MMPVLCKCLECDKEFTVIPSRYESGRGKFCSRICKDTNQKTNLPKTSFKTGENRNWIKTNHYRWKSTDASYSAKHDWIRRHHGSANRCDADDCTGKSKIYEWANQSGRYLREVTDYKMMCRSCHRLFDNGRKRAGL